MVSSKCRCRWAQAGCNVTYRDLSSINCVPGHESNADDSIVHLHKMSLCRKTSETLKWLIKIWPEAPRNFKPHTDSRNNVSWHGSLVVGFTRIPQPPTSFLRPSQNCFTVYEWLTDHCSFAGQEETSCSEIMIMLYMVDVNLPLSIVKNKVAPFSSDRILCIPAGLKLTM